jgi:hypothetical protein
LPCDFSGCWPEGCQVLGCRTFQAEGTTLSGSSTLVGKRAE